MARLVLIAVVIAVFILILISYKVGEQKERKEHNKIVEERKAKAEFEKNIDKLADEISKRNR